MYIYLYKRNVI